jgi:hypothetical protein
MMSWISGVLFVLASLVTSWFIAQDEPNFALGQMAAGLLLVMPIAFLLAFWQELSNVFGRALSMCPSHRGGRGGCKRSQ